MRQAAYAAAMVLALTSAGSALAQKSDYPTKPVRLIVPYPPGGGNDTLARLFSAKLTEAWGQQIVVDNRGAGTTKALALPDVKERLATLGADIVASSPEQTAAFFRSELAKYTKVAHAANIHAE